MAKNVFSIYEHTLVYEEKLLTRQLIVIKDEDGNIVKWTNFHKYIQSGKTSVKRIFSDTGMRGYNVVKLLNYAFFGNYSIKRIEDITANIVKDFLNDYGLCRLPGDDESTHRSKSTVNICVAHIIDFLERMIRDNPSCKMRVDQLYTTETVFDKRKKRHIMKKIPTFNVYYKSDKLPILRDLPDEAFKILLNVIIDSHTNILMLAALGAFAGLRPSEACNVRREDSELGPGIRFTMENGEVVSAEIDLTKELNLRSDLKSVGKIKKERRQKVYPAFLEIFTDCYNRYMDYIKGKPYETNYGALTNNSTGKAYTYDTYLYQFNLAVKDCIPIMLASSDPEVVNYGHLLQEHRISPHILRHWYSVKLALYGEDVAGLMYWRGDSVPESALTYLMNKGDLDKQLTRVSDSVFDYSSWKAAKLNQLRGNE